MKAILARALAGVMALTPMTGCASPSVQPDLPPAPAGGCQPVDEEVDYGRVKPNPGELARMVAEAEKAHAEVRARTGVSAESPPPPRIRVFTWGSFLPGRYSLVATANDRGEWDVVKAAEGREGGRLPAEPPAVARFSITGDQAAQLNRIVFDRCLFAEPTYYGRTVPMTGGGEATCADGADSLIEVEIGGRVHRSFHACHTFGRPGQAANLLWSATNSGG